MSYGCKYEKLKDQEIEAVIKKHIVPIGINTIYNYITIIVYGDLYEHGYYKIYKKNGKREVLFHVSRIR
ncbi:MAG: hypothetical protein N4A57_16615 [Anaeromicrobium sp.]|jgi:superoxide dismutase|nr:hypothetical protein [Anaeromicrobium sp.]